MAAFLNVCRFTPTAGSTTDWTYSAAVTGYNSPALAGVVNSRVYKYRAESADLSQWEIGEGAYNTGTGVLARTTVLYNSSGTGTGTGQSGAGSKINFSVAPTVAIVAVKEDLLAIEEANAFTAAQKAQAQTNLGVREVLAAARTYYVRAVVGAPTISIATPAVVTLTAHGLTTNDPVVFSVLQNMTACTISTANPAVVTMTNTFAAGQPVKFSSGCFLPYPIVAGTTYYVISTGLSGASFRISTSVGGAAVDTSRLAVTASSGTGAAILFTNAGTNGVTAGQIVTFVTNGGSLPTNISASTAYYVSSSPAPSATTFYVSTTPTGANVAYSAAGSAVYMEQAGFNSGATAFAYNSTYATTTPSIYHYCSTVGALPTGITQGTTYYVLSSGLTADAFQVSTSAGGAAVNTSGSVTGTPIYSVATGNDSNTGLAQTRAAAFLTIQKAVNTVAALDLSIYTPTIQLAHGTYTEEVSLKNVVGAGPVVITGNTTTPSNVLHAGLGSVACYFADALSVIYQISGIKMTTANRAVQALGGSTVELSSVDIGYASGRQLQCRTGAQIRITGSITVSAGSASYHTSAEDLGYYTAISMTYRILDNPSFAVGWVASSTTAVSVIYSNTYLGSARGSKYKAQTLGNIFVNGAGADALPGNAAGTTATSGIYG